MEKYGAVPQTKATLLCGAHSQKPRVEVGQKVGQKVGFHQCQTEAAQQSVA